MGYEKQVSRAHYDGKAYRSPERWMSYWHQLETVRATKAREVLEIGLGEGVVARELTHRGVSVVTLDIAEDLKPDIVGSVTAMPIADRAYDAVLAAEILEHIRFEDVGTALAEIARVTRMHAVITLPHPGYVFLATLKLPMLRRLTLFFQLPFFWKAHRFDGQHYWELGKRTYPLSRFLDEARRAGLRLVSTKKYSDDPAHRVFLFERIES